MRTLFLWVYLLIVGGFVGAFYLMEYFGGDLYDKEFAHGYRDYVSRISPLIAADLKTSKDQQATLAYWQIVVGEELVNLQLITIPEKLGFSSGNVMVTHLETTELADEIRLVVKLPDFSGQNKALTFYFVDTVSETYESWYQKGIVGIFVFMALWIGVLVFYLSNYLQQVKSLTNSVIDGDLNARMGRSVNSVFRSLSENLNHMVRDLKSKHQESDIFLGAIHHELRSPITKLRLALDMALSSHDEALLKELLHDMDVDLEELNGLMEDILTLSRLRLQKNMPECTEFDVIAIIEAMITELADPKISFYPVGKILVSSNKLLLERALVNITCNALKFAKHKVLIEVNHNSDGVLISVSDDGPGIPAAEKNLIFKPFYRIDKGRTRNTGGVGLGLAIAQLVMIKISGDIKVEDSLQGGARFVVQLPYKNYIN